MTVKEIAVSKKVKEIWDRMNRSEKYGCRFTLYPQWVEEYDPSLDDYVALAQLSEEMFGEL